MTAAAVPVQVPVELGDRRYTIWIAPGLLHEPAAWQGLPRAATALIVSNDVVAPLYADALAAALASHYGQVGRVQLPDGEAHKDWPALNRIFDTLLADAADRDTVLFALGGGVVGDMTGFAAACYMRGVPLVQVPTTLLAQVDSSVGGKTAINHPLGKNMIGAFHQPARVVCDLATLATLPAREISAGLAEVIKYGPIADAAFFDWLETHLDAVRALEPAALTHAVQRSCEVKARIVAADEREAGQRAWLNFGHTFGHAIEAGMGWGAWLHGEAVGAGMCMAAELSRRLGLIDAATVARIIALVARAGLPTRGPALRELTIAAHLHHMRVDKKAQAGALRFVVLTELGAARLQAVDEALVRETLAACCD
ncbi:MAG: 3-dehydroquinate synthase [Proteobacteria bacterium]|nr:3-dehydroquinate synthase [Pseudomonadota bacterium]